MQSRLDSLMEAATNILVGFVVAFVGNYIILPLVLDVKLSPGDSFIIAAMFTLISLARQYAIRRAFNGRSVWEAIKCRIC